MVKRDIKLLLSKVEHKLNKTIHERPSREALDRLAVFAGFQDWESFRKELHEGAGTTDDAAGEDVTSK